MVKKMKMLLQLHQDHQLKSWNM